MDITILLIGAFATAAIDAAIGVAGGAMLLALILLYFPVEIAIPLHACTQLISNGTRVAIFLPHVQWKAWFYFLVPAVVGTFFGRELFIAADPTTLKHVIAGFILFAIYRPKGKADTHWPVWTMGIAGALAGTMGMLIGAVNPITAPFFLRANILKEKMIATISTCQGLIHLLKVVAFGTLSFAFDEHAQLIILLGVAVIGGAFFGKKLVGKISEPMFKLLFKGSLTLIAIKLLVWG